MEPGKDGVGDYTQRLSNSLEKKGFEVAIVAINDNNIRKVIEGRQCDNQKIKTLRIPANTSFEEKFTYAQKWIRRFKPDWISLQFVNYAFHYKGMPYKWSTHFKKLDTQCRWHIMFHELWVGIQHSDSNKTKLVGFLQKFIIKRTINSVAPLSIATNTEHYKTKLKTIGVQPTVIPVFTNMPENIGQNLKLWSELPDEIINNREHFIVAVFFGGLIVSGEVIEKIKILKQKATFYNKTLFLTHVGRSGSVKHFFTDLKEKFDLNNYVFGERKGEDIVAFFKQADVGLSTYNSQLLAKSGSAAAMLNNGLPVILLGDDVGTPYPFARDITHIDSLPEFCNQEKSFSNLFSLDNASQYYQEVFSAIE